MLHRWIGNVHERRKAKAGKCRSAASRSRARDYWRSIFSGRSLVRHTLSAGGQSPIYVAKGTDERVQTVGHSNSLVGEARRCRHKPKAAASRLPTGRKGKSGEPTLPGPPLADGTGERANHGA